MHSRTSFLQKSNNMTNISCDDELLYVLFVEQETVCSSNPCQNGGACVVGLNNYTCSCVDVYGGDHCESKVKVYIIHRDFSI